MHARCKSIIGIRGRSPNYRRLLPMTVRAPSLNSWLLLLLLAGCAAQPPLTRPGATQAEVDEDRLHCQALMYSERASRGRSAPNWNLYEYCMRARGYAR